MTNIEMTKRALLSSILALLLCFTTLLGMTYAWFTDSFSSDSNIIQAGNLDVQVEYTHDGANWKNLDGAKDLFKDGYWEPGHTEIVALRITNSGTLELNYTAHMNIVEEIIGVNKAGKDIVLSEILKVNTITYDAGPIGDALLGYYLSSEDALTDNETTFKDFNILGSDNAVLPVGTAKYIIIKVDMPITVGNEANAKDKDSLPAIKFGINVFATQRAEEEDSFGNQYDADAPIIVKNHEEAQAALDNAGAGTTIQLMPGVNFGTLEVRAQVVSQNKKPVIVNENTEQVDYYTTKYPTGEFVRHFDDITIIGAPGAKVDAINFVNGTFKATGEDGTSTGTMYRFVKVNNFVIDGVEFTDNSAITPDNKWYSPLLFNLPGVQVDGLTVKNCTLEGENNKMNFVYAYGNTAKDCTFEATLKNVNIVNNTVSGIARLCELREAENVNIKGNNVANLTRELALLSNNTGKAYSGDINVIGNTADNVAIDYTADGYNALVVRVGIGGDATIVVEDNVIVNTTPIDANDFVKVTEHTGTLTVENNTLN